MSLISLTFFGIISTAIISLCLASKVAIDKPTYHVPATAVFILITPFAFLIYSVGY